MIPEVAFYAPMKPPDHRTPSGDRTLARLLVAAIESAGYSVHVISRFRSWAATAEEQDRRRTLAAAELEQVAGVFRRRRPDLWLTYHLSHKAPDWLGPSLSKRFRVPYLVAEASYAPRHVTGPWMKGVADVRSALDAARIVFVMKARDCPALEDLPGLAPKLVCLPPFVDTDLWPLAERRGRKEPVHLLTVAMMRPGAKLASYRHLAAALRHVQGSWRLTVVGDGPVRPEVQSLLKPLGMKVRFTGSVGSRKLKTLYHDADCLVWPGIAEGIGMVFLEAQATGLPIAACETAGVPQIVRHGCTGLLAPHEDPATLGAAISVLIEDKVARRRMGRAAAALVRVQHDIPRAHGILGGVLSEMRIPA